MMTQKYKLRVIVTTSSIAVTSMSGIAAAQPAPKKSEATAGAGLTNG